MARERMVTRTVTEATVKCMVVDGMEVKFLDVNVGSVNGLKESQIIDKVKSLLPEGTLFVKADKEDILYVEVLYGMPEDEFIKNAKVLPPRTAAE